MAKVQLGRNLSPDERDGILAFLEALTGKIPEDALRIPLLPAVKEPSKP